MGIGGRLAQQDEVEFDLSAQLLRRRSHERTDISWRHARAHLRIGPAIGGHGDIGRLLHQGDFGGGLAHAQRPGDGVLHQRGGGHGILQTVDREVAHAFLDANAPLGESLRRQEVGNGRIGAFMLLPDANLGRDGKRFVDRGFLEKGTDDERRAAGGDDQRGKPLAAMPADAAIIDEAGARFDQQRVDAVPLHHRLRTGKATGALRLSDRRDVASQGRERLCRFFLREQARADQADTDADSCKAQNSAAIRRRHRGRPPPKPPDRRGDRASPSTSE